MTQDSESLKPCPFCGGRAAVEVDNEEWEIARVLCTNCDADGPYEDLAEQASEADAVKKACDRWNTRLAATPSTSVREEVVPPVNGETDPEWRAIRRAIDQFAGRVPTISKHRAVHNEHLRQLVERLDAAGDREAADTIVWQCWYRALDRERERFLLDDARTAALVPSPDEGKRHG